MHNNICLPFLTWDHVNTSNRCLRTKDKASVVYNLRVKLSSYGKGRENEESNKKRKLWISLSKEEIEEDIYAFTGSKPARRPNKRNKTLQKQLDNLFPGLYLDGISPDSYRP